MRIRTVAPLLAAAILLAFGVADTASAGKEVFVRSKPHVNVGTIGRNSSPAQNTGNLAIPVAPASASTHTVVVEHRGAYIMGSLILPNR